MRKIFSFLPLLGLVLAASACDDAAGSLIGPGDDGPRYDHFDTVQVAISAPDTIYTQGTATAYATLTQGSGSWRYTWYFRNCNGTSATTCSPSWTQVADGTNVTSVQQTVYSTDWWVEWKVDLRDIYGHVGRTDTHRTYGPRSVSPPPPDTVVVTISGSNYVTSPGDEEYTASTDGGTGPWTYTWEQNVAGQGWEEIGWGQNPVNVCINPQEMGAHTYNLKVRVTVTNGTDSDSDEMNVTVSLPSGRAFPCSAW